MSDSAQLRHRALDEVLEQWMIETNASAFEQKRFFYR